jgi:AcrR family transcriptional regulator
MTPVALAAAATALAPPVPSSALPASLASARRRERLTVALGALIEEVGEQRLSAAALCERAGVPLDALRGELGSLHGCREARAQALASRRQARTVCGWSDAHDLQ